MMDLETLRQEAAKLVMLMSYGELLGFVDKLAHREHPPLPRSHRPPGPDSEGPCTRIHFSFISQCIRIFTKSMAARASSGRSQRSRTVTAWRTCQSSNNRP